MTNSLLAVEFQFVCAEADLPLGKSKRVILDGVPIAVFHIDDGFYAIEDTCSHQGASLAFGDLERVIVACPRHGAQFDVRSGRVLSLPAVRGVRCYPVKVEEGRVFVGCSLSSDLTPDLLRLA